MPSNSEQKEFTTQTSSQQKVVLNESELRLKDGLSLLCEEPFLHDGTSLSPHQIDALSGTLNAVLSGEKRIWFEHATGSGKTVAALGFIDSNRRNKTLVLTHRRALVKQFKDELSDRGYSDLLEKEKVVIDTYQWFVRNSEQIKEQGFNLVICDEVHTALGEKTSAAIKDWSQPIWIGMTATGQLIAKSVSDLFPYQASRFDLGTAAHHRVISSLRCMRVAPGPYVNSIKSVSLRKTGSDIEFDQNELATLLDQAPFNFAAADFYKHTFGNLPGVVYAAGVEHAHHVEEAFQSVGLRAKAVSGQTPDKQLEKILQSYNQGELDVLINAQLLIEGWNSPRATVCMHLAPTASKRIYQQRVGRVTRLHPDKETGIVVDFVHASTPHSHPIVTLHSLTNRNFYRPGAVVVGQISNNYRSPIKVRRLLVPISDSEYDRHQVIEKNWERVDVSELTPEDRAFWVENAAQSMRSDRWELCFKLVKDLPDTREDLLVHLLKRDRFQQRAISEITKQPLSEQSMQKLFDQISSWERSEALKAVKGLLLGWSKSKKPASKNWIWQAAAYGRIWHEKQASKQWEEFGKMVGHLTNTSGPAHLKALRRIVSGTSDKSEECKASVLAALHPHTPEAEEVLQIAQVRSGIKNARLAEILYANFPQSNQTHERVGYEPQEVANARRDFIKNVLQQRDELKTVFSKHTEDGWVLCIKCTQEDAAIPEAWMGIPLSREEELQKV